MNNVFRKYFPYIIIVVWIGLLVLFIKNSYQEPFISQDYSPEVFEKPASFPTPDVRNKSVIHTLKIPIIMYHYVEKISNRKDTTRIRLTTTPELFEEQLKQLSKAKYQTYFAKDMPDILQNKITVSSNSAVLTFDDGYEDFYTVAFPLLKKYNMKSTLYVIVNYVGKKGFLTWSQIIKLRDSGIVEIGSHTMNHINLQKATEKESQKEIFSSKTILEGVLGKPVVSFAYPIGAFGLKDIELVKKAGYVDAVSVISGQEQSDLNIFILSRIRANYLVGNDIPSILRHWKK
ncbi:MAG: polysaccharide deacetylase family protein [Candidatus Roizmanbacteria bacterium]